MASIRPKIPYASPSPSGGRRQIWGNAVFNHSSTVWTAADRYELDKEHREVPAPPQVGETCAGARLLMRPRWKKAAA